MNDFESTNSTDCCHRQTHVHEFLGSVSQEGCGANCHNHRFAGVTDEVIPCGPNNHVHMLTTRTDFYGDHFHTICEITGPAVYVGDCRHVHFVCGETSEQCRHDHDFIFATLIDNPTCD